MIKIIPIVLTLSALLACAAQGAPAAPKHFRLTFVLSYSNPEHPSQTFTLDVPVTAGKLAMASMSSAASLVGQIEGSLQEGLTCTDIHESSTGLAANIAFEMDGAASEHLPNSTEPLHHKVTFNRQVDLVLGKPTRITNEMGKMKPLKEGDEVFIDNFEAPQITVTVAEL